MAIYPQALILIKSRPDEGQQSKRGNYSEQQEKW